MASRLATTKVTVEKVVNGPFAVATQLVPAKGKIPAFCQVTGSFVTNAKTGKTANFLGNFPAGWNGKYMQIGCSSHCGQFYVSNPAMPSVIVTTQGNPGDIMAKGYAAFATDEGHAGLAAADWAVREDGTVDQDYLDDFYYRAVKILADLGKKFTAVFYTQAGLAAAKIKRSYFVGYSGGRRDAMVATSYFPEKFDGIIAGSPYDPLGMGVHSVGLDILKARPGAAVSPAMFDLIDGLVKKQCDGLDGVMDGVIQNPLACNLRPDRDLPRCSGDQSGGQCFTQPQIDYVSALVSAMTDEQGRVLQPGDSVSELRGTGVGDLGTGLLKVFVHRNDPAFTAASHYSFQSGGAGGIDAFHVVLQAEEGARILKELRPGAGHLPENMHRQRASKTKLMIWHNFSDEALTPLSSINYYNALAKQYGGLEKAQRQARLFLLPATHHCSIEGVAPNQFDAVTAMENWVERGQAPEELTLTVTNHQFTPGAKPAAAMQWPDWTAKVCRYPALARYKGHGELKDAANWQCSPDDRRGLQVGESGRQGGFIR